MPGYFICHHCGKLILRNPRLKANQKYCGSKACQQARKNCWEADKLKRDPSYMVLRKSQKKRWRKNRPAHEYQKVYREKHPLYTETNRKQQLIRNKKTAGIALENKTGKIVNTDALIAENLIRCGFYNLQPIEIPPGKKIVKTDAFVVEILAHRGFPEVLVSESG
jgi:hypothetical protein